MSVKKNAELIMLEALNDKLEELIESIFKEDIEEEYVVDTKGTYKDMEEPIELSKEAYDMIQKYCPNKNNLFIGIT